LIPWRSGRLHYAHPILAGIVFAGLFAAIMSTADGFLNIGAAALVHDLSRAIRGTPLHQELFWARIVTVLMALLASARALTSKDLVALLGAFGWGTFAAAVFPCVALGFNWSRATALATNVSIVTSLAVNLAIKALEFSIPYGIDGGAISLLLSLTLFLGISLASNPPDIDPDIRAAMDL